MQSYEDKHLRDKVNRIIARQKDGQIILAAYSDGSGLLSREELGLEVTRAAYPYDYAVGKIGFLKYDSALGAYLYTPKPGEKQPSALANYHPLSLAEATLEVQNRRLQIQSGETHLSFTGVQAWKGLYEILREVNEELARIQAGIVVWKIYRDESQPHPADHSLFQQAAPRLRNGQALVYVTGYAYDANRNLVYSGLVGYKTSLESLRMTLIAGKLVQLEPGNGGTIPLTPIDKYEQVWQPMPEYTSHHAAFISRLALPGKWEPEDSASYLLAFHGTTNLHHELIRLLSERLKEALEVPILDEWATDLWQAATSRQFIQPLTIGGDCLAGVRIDLAADWKELLTDLLAQQVISL